MRVSIGTQVVVAVAATAALTIGSLSVLIVRAQRAALVGELTRGANQIGETIRSSTYHDMLENRRDNLRRQIATIGAQNGIDGVRLFNKDGLIAFSSDPDDVGHSVDKQAESCYVCHAAGQPPTRLPVSERARVFRAADGHRVLGIIHPIPNQPSCSTAACHAHGSSGAVLGVLDVAVSLAEVDRNIAASQRSLVGLATAVVLASSAILFWLHRRLVLSPVAALASATHRVAAGDLATSIPAGAANELGDLARDFNVMVQRLAESQRQLTQADKLASVGRLAAGVAHEINNPLTGVLTYASFLLKRAENPETRQDLEVIVRETKRCREIVKALLDFSRPAPLHRQPTDLNEVARRSVDILANQLSLKRVTFALELAPALPTTHVDPNQLEQVVVNLLLNGLEAMGDGQGRLSLRTRVGGKGDTVEIEVEDSGCGITADAMPHIFEPFFSTKAAKGTGLGLAVTWGIVQSHGGVIDVTSEPDKGSRFVVSIPCRPQTTEKTA
jgi:two-component system NtrC family sensor kinase